MVDKVKRGDRLYDVTSGDVFEVKAVSGDKVDLYNESRGYDTTVLLRDIVSYKTLL